MAIPDSVKANIADCEILKEIDNAVNMRSVKLKAGAWTLDAWIHGLPEVGGKMTISGVREVSGEWTVQSVEPTEHGATIQLSRPNSAATYPQPPASSKPQPPARHA